MSRGAKGSRNGVAKFTLVLHDVGSRQRRGWLLATLLVGTCNRPRGAEISEGDTTGAREQSVKLSTAGQTCGLTASGCFASEREGRGKG